MRTQIVINSTQVDLLQEVSLNITKQLIDIQNPEQRKTDRTLTIDIPGSTENDKLFSFLFEANVDLHEDDTAHLVKHFNPNKKAPVVIYIDSVEQLRGYCQLTDIVITQRDKVVYKIVCYGEIGDLFAKLGNSRLEDLDLSEFDHIYNKTNIKNSWETSIIKNGSSTAFSPGTGYVYPMIDYGFSTDKANWKVEYFRPAIYVKQYIDKIFSTAGYSYTSDFFNTDFFKKLIIPFNSEKFILDEEEVESRLFYAGLTEAKTVDFQTQKHTVNTATAIPFDEDTADPFFDNGSQFNTATGKFVCSKAGKYTFKGRVKARLKNESAGTFSSFSDHFDICLAIYKQTAAGISAVATKTGAVSLTGFTINNGATSSEGTININSNEIFAEVGDEFFIGAACFYHNIADRRGFTYAGWKLLITFDSDCYFANSVVNDSIYDGATLDVNSCIPSEVKQRDFLGSIIKAFNLYVEPHPDKENNLIIEPRADYYTGQFTDWTQKLDTSKEFTIQPLAAADAVEYVFTYAADEDYINKAYRSQFGRIYGDHNIKIDNDFVKNTKKVELIFAPTPSFSEKNIDRIIPYIAFTDQNKNVTPKACKIRILQYGGMKLCINKWNLIGSGGSESLEEYPFAGHNDEPYSPQFDLNFGIPLHIYYDSYTEAIVDLTNQNLYTRYWDAQISELTDINSKLVEGWFYLTPNDIHKLSFRQYYFIKDAYYRLLKIENYDPVFSKVTKCQFLKVLVYDAPLAAVKKSLGGRGTIGNTTNTTYKMPTMGDVAPANGNRGNAGTTVVVGRDNSVSGSAAFAIVNGTNNYVFAGAERVNILGGGDNLVFSNTSDVMLINCSGLVVTEPNVFYINNQKFSLGQIGDAVSVSESPYTLTDAERTLFVDASEGAFTVNLPTAEGRNGKTFEIIKTDDTGNLVTIDAFESQTINGNTTVSLATPYDKLVIISDGAQWFKLN